MEKDLYLVQGSPKVQNQPNQIKIAAPTKKPMYLFASMIAISPLKHVILNSVSELQRLVKNPINMSFGPPPC